MGNQIDTTLKQLKELELRTIQLEKMALDQGIELGKLKTELSHKASRAGAAK